jgi:hypothetical protein
MRFLAPVRYTLGIYSNVRKITISANPFVLEVLDIATSIISLPKLLKVGKGGYYEMGNLSYIPGIN